MSLWSTVPVVNSMLELNIFPLEGFDALSEGVD